MASRKTLPPRWSWLHWILVLWGGENKKCEIRRVHSKKKKRKKLTNTAMRRGLESCLFGFPWFGYSWGSFAGGMRSMNHCHREKKRKNFNSQALKQRQAAERATLDESQLVVGDVSVFKTKIIRIVLGVLFFLSFCNFALTLFSTHTHTHTHIHTIPNANRWRANSQTHKDCRVDMRKNKDASIFKSRL